MKFVIIFFILNSTLSYPVKIDPTDEASNLVSEIMNLMFLTDGKLDNFFADSFLFSSCDKGILEKQTVISFLKSFPFRTKINTDILNAEFRNDLLVFSIRIRGIGQASESEHFARPTLQNAAGFEILKGAEINCH